MRVQSHICEHLRDPSISDLLQYYQKKYSSSPKSTQAAIYRCGAAFQMKSFPENEINFGICFVAETRKNKKRKSAEDLENKGNKKKNTKRGGKKKVLEEANNSKLRRHVQVRVEDCLLRSCKKEVPPPEPVEEVKEKEEEVPRDDKSEESAGCSVVEEKLAIEEDGTEPSVILEVRPDEDEGLRSSSSPLSRMESATALLRFPDDRSDSGVSSLRSGSGDERSGSRSSALSSSDEQNQLNRSPLFVWRDPSLLVAGEPQVRHINSVQHHSLLMSHPPAPAVTATPNTSGSVAVSQAQALALAQAHYPSVVPPPPPLLSPHHLHHHPHAVPHLPPPGLYPDMLWNKRYPPLPVGTHLLAPAHPNPEDFLAGERERVFR